MNATPTNWKKLADRFTNIGVSVTTRDNKKYLIKLLLGTDAVHGDQHGVGNVIFPHNIGLASSHNPTNF
jgi:beta-glucosidase